MISFIHLFLFIFSFIFFLVNYDELNYFTSKCFLWISFMPSSNLIFFFLIYVYWFFFCFIHLTVGIDIVGNYKSLRTYIFPLFFFLPLNSYRTVHNSLFNFFFFYVKDYTLVCSNKRECNKELKMKKNFSNNFQLIYRLDQFCVWVIVTPLDTIEQTKLFSSFILFHLVLFFFFLHQFPCLISYVQQQIAFSKIIMIYASCAMNLLLDLIIPLTQIRNLPKTTK